MTGHVYKKKRAVAEGEEEERVIMHDGDVSSSVTSESEHSDRAPGGRFSPVRSLRQNLCNILHSTKFQVLIVSLVIFNCLVVIVELLINLRIFQLQRSFDNTAANVLHFVNVSILSLFVLEMGLKILVFGTDMLKQKMEMFDFVVVILAFSLGLALREKEHSADGVGLLIMLRLWRVTKILNSMVASVKVEADRKMAKERRSRRALEREVAKLREYCLQQECELQMYRMMLQQNGIPQPTVLRPPPAPRTLSVIAEVNEMERLDSSSPSPTSMDRKSSQNSPPPLSGVE